MLPRLDVPVTRLCENATSRGRGSGADPNGSLQCVPPVRAYRALHLQIGPPDGDLGALIVVDAQMLAEDLALHRHPEILAFRS